MLCFVFKEPQLFTKAVCACWCCTTSQTLVSNRALPPHFGFLSQKAQLCKGRMSAKGAGATVEASNPLCVDRVWACFSHTFEITCRERSCVGCSARAQSERLVLGHLSSMLCYKTLPPSVSRGLSPRSCIQVWKGLEGSAESKMWTQKIANKRNQHQLCCIALCPGGWTVRSGGSESTPTTYTQSQCRPGYFLSHEPEALPNREALTGSSSNMVPESAAGPVYRFMSPECQFYASCTYTRPDFSNVSNVKVAATADDFGIAILSGSSEKGRDVGLWEQEILVRTRPQETRQSFLSGQDTCKGVVSETWNRSIFHLSKSCCPVMLPSPPAPNPQHSLA